LSLILPYLRHVIKFVFYFSSFCLLSLYVID
jgi:hypothetical protein